MGTENYEGVQNLGTTGDRFLKGMDIDLRMLVGAKLLFVRMAVCMYGCIV